MKYDCSKTLDFFHELVRQCKDIANASLDPEVVGCTLSGCSLAGKITQEQINELQKWSDGHPEKTRADAFFELFPQAMRTSKDKVYYPALCYGYLIEDFMCNKVAPDCFTCWNEPYAGEFEKAREEE